MSAIAVISIFICLVGLAVGLQVSAQDLQTAESKREQAEMYAKGNDHQTVGSSYGGSSYGGSGVYGSPYGNDRYGQRDNYGHGSYGGYGQSGHPSFGGGSYSAGSNYGLNPSYGVSPDKNNAPGSKLSIHGIAKAHILSSRLSNAAKDKGKDAAENVGSAHLSNYQSYQAPILPRPAYPSPVSPMNCGSNLLISCNPTYRFAPCSSY